MKVLSQIQRYGLAAISCGLALVLAWLLDAPTSCFFLAVMVSSLYGGKGPGLFAVGFSALAFDYYFLPPVFHFYLDSSSLLRFGPFLGAILLIIGLIEANRRGEEARLQIAGQVQRSEAYLAEAQKLSRSGSWAFAADSMNTTYWSEEMFRIVGLPPADHPPSVEEFETLFPPEAWARLKEIFEASRLKKTTFDGDFPLILKDGTNRTLRMVGHPVVNSSGEILEFVGTAIDVTEQRQARAALQRAFDEIKGSEDRLRLIIDTIPVPAWSSRPDGSTDFMNRRWLDYTGIPVEEALGWGWKVVMHPDDLDRTMEYWRSVLADHEERELEARMLRFDGMYRWFLFRVSPLRDASGRIVQWYGTSIDIEDRKQAEESVRQRERDLTMIVETMPGLVWCAAPNGELNYVNRRILDYIGTNPQALAQAGWLNFLHPDDVQPTINAWSNAVVTGDPHDVQYRLRRFDGTYRWFHVLGQPACDADGHRTRWYGLLIDIDDRKNMEEALRSTQVRLSKAAQTATVGELAASIAHEINQPLAAVGSKQQAGDGILVEVRDCGPGLAEPEKAFEAFYTTKESGLGMGLAICRSIVEAHQGHLWAESAGATGAAFCFTLPNQASTER